LPGIIQKLLTLLEGRYSVRLHCGTKTEQKTVQMNL
jgi:hypothetical protein